MSPACPQINLVGAFLNWSSLFSNDSSLFKLTKQTSKRPNQDRVKRILVVLWKAQDAGPLSIRNRMKSGSTRLLNRGQFRIGLDESGAFNPGKIHTFWNEWIDWFNLFSIILPERIEMFTKWIKNLTFFLLVVFFFKKKVGFNFSYVTKQSSKGHGLVLCALGRLPAWLQVLGVGGSLFLEDYRVILPQCRNVQKVTFSRKVGVNSGPFLVFG